MKHRLFDFYASKDWAIMPEWLQEMFDIYQTAIERQGIGIDFNPEALSAKLGRPLDNSRTVTVRNGTAIIPVLGPIFPRANLFTQISNATSVDVLATDFNQALNDPSVHSIILDVDSPGGAVDGISEFAGMVFDAREKKPVVAYVANLGASAAYWIASAASEVIANDTASLGSIGVVGGVCVAKDKSRVEFVSSQSPNKRPDPTTEAGRSQFQAHVDTLAEVFIGTVARNRSMPADDVIQAGGAGGLRVGQHAVDAGLADRTGTLEGVIAELADAEARMKKINKRKMLSSTDVEQFAETAALHFSESQTIGANEMADETKDKPSDAQPPKTEAVKEPLADNSAEIETLRADKAQAEKQAQESATALTVEKQAREELEKRVAAMEKDARTTRFTELAKDWSGDKAFHLDMLEHIATSEKDGEQSARFKGYLTQQDAVAEQLRQSALFIEVGAREPVEGSATAKLEALARKRADESGGKVTYEQAYVAIRDENPALRREADTEARIN